ncbi:SDR family NAD(P)-dependent oxidoreductase [Ruegeria sp. EL01]|uniref:SDR family NAD(P)-dependent oxidoreductase n=1 Tax=Ruegeria sp. EL01 TaxID=2107578 RepID=UPI000EA8272D|nr:SDR family oxidoreductase [Ruegeria sp. EL01]
MELEGKRALVTGGGKGMGAAIAKRLAQEGADVVVTYSVSKGPAEEVAESIRALGRKAQAISADSRDADQIRSAVQAAGDLMGGIDIVVNNAGIFRWGMIEDLSIEDFDDSISVNFRSAYVTTKEAMQYIPDGGRIIFIGSNLASRAHFPGLAAYTSTKLALSGLAHALGRELGPRGITANAIHPGSTNTDMNPADADDADMKVAAAARQAFMDTSEIADLVVFLASQKGRSITGADLVIDNGANA